MRVLLKTICGCTKEMDIPELWPSIHIPIMKQEKIGPISEKISERVVIKARTFQRRTRDLDTGQYIYEEHYDEH